MITEKDRYYLMVARAVGAKAKCLRSKVGAITVRDDQIMSTGYAGAPRGRLDCVEVGKCFRVENNIPRGSDYLLCRSVHAETNACIHAGRERTLGSTLYLYGYHRPCEWCARVMINAGIKRVVCKGGEGEQSQEFDPKHLDFETAQVREWVEGVVNESVGEE